jgi:hypothetical protein
VRTAKDRPKAAYLSLGAAEAILRGIERRLFCIEFQTRRRGESIG